MRVTLLAACLLASVAVPATAAVAGGASPPLLSAQDRAFVVAAGHGGAFEVAGGKLAATRAAHPALRAFGTRMAADHTKAGTKLRTVANAVDASLGEDLPTAPDPHQQAILDLWSGVESTVFDCSYAPTEYLDHVASVGTFERQARHGTNPQLRAFARDTLPTIVEHRTMIAELLTKVRC